MTTRAPRPPARTTTNATRARTRALARTCLGALTVALLAAAIFVGEIEFITVALLVGVAGIAVDLRQTTQLARARTGPELWPRSS